jgi:tetratricopeptide (TPR) repeat protein/predicted regulator of Ras-like GTPase activity (Roadblock/LC7/MglB family)
MGIFSRTLSRLDELKRALTRDPASRQFLALADELRRQGQVEEAIEVLKRGLEQSPAAVAGHVALGRLLQGQGRLDEASVAFQDALNLDPQNLVAIRQLADLHLSRGDKVEAIKKLKLFRGLSPGDREVNELIRQLDGEIAEAGRQPARTEPVSAVPEAPALPEVGSIPPPVAPFVPLPLAPELPGVRAEPAVDPRDVEPSTPRTGPEPGGEAPLAALAEDARESAAGAAGGLRPIAGEDRAREVDGTDEGDRAPGTVPPVTETLAELLRAQGHLGEAREAYLDLARTSADAERAQAFRLAADDIGAARARTTRGRLEAWLETFGRRRERRGGDLAGVVEEALKRLGASAAVVTDFEGVPVVAAGPRSEGEAMENLAAELTAFWKNVRRSRAEIGEGTLECLVLAGANGTAAVRVITPEYALLLKAGPGIPAGRIRYEAARAAELLRPALL